MLHSSNSSLTSFSFSMPATQSVCTNDRTTLSAPTPPSELVLRCAGSVGRRADPGALSANISTLPLVLLHLIKKWLTSKESVSLILTSRHLHHQVQAYYKKLLRPTVAETSSSCVASFQNSVNIARTHLPMEAEGEEAFQMCLKLKATGLPGSAYRHGVLSILKRCIEESRSPYHLCEVSTGIGLGLGGTLMTEQDRDALLNCILDSAATCTSHHLNAMMVGACVAFGRLHSQHHMVAALKKILACHATCKPDQMNALTLGVLDGTGSFGRLQEELETVLALILGANKTCTADQLSALMHSVGMMLEGPAITPVQRGFVLTRILDSFGTSQPAQLGGMIGGFCNALGNVTMAPAHRDGIMAQILGTYATNRRLPLKEMMYGFCVGLGGSVMTPENLDAILGRIIGCYKSWNHKEMGMAIGHLCRALGGRNLAPANRDRVLAGILKAYATSSPDQMGSMIGCLCRSTFNNTPNGVIITQDNLEAILLAVLNSHATVSPAQMGVIFEWICFALSIGTMLQAHHGTLVARIRESDHANEIIAAMKLRPNGPLVMKYLQLHTVRDTTKKQANTTISL